MAVGVGQTTDSSTQCCDPMLSSCQQMVQQCLASSFSTDSMRCQSICDPSMPDCQTMISQCMASSTATSTSRCQSLACYVPSPMPSLDSTIKPSPLPSPLISGSGSDSGSDGSSRCCDGTTETCKMTISMCLATTGNPSMCERIACPSPGASPYPTPRQCCDGSMPGCQMAYRECMNEAGSADMCGMIICRNDNGSPAPTMRPVSQCCDPSLAMCQMAVRECLAMGQPESMCMMIMCTQTSQPDKPLESARPSRSAAPTMFIRPMFSTMPSRLPRRTALPINFKIPDRLPAALTFPRANISMFKNAEKLQEIQAKLACILRLPLENIELRNISILRATGKLEALDIDVTVARLSSNGSMRCIVFKDDPVVPQTTPGVTVGSVRRNLQMTTESVVVNYDIVSPPEEIAIASSSELSAVISGDASMVAFANSVGSTGLSAGVTPISGDGGSGQTVDGGMNTIAVGIGVAVGAVAVIGVGVAFNVYSNRKRRQARHVIQSAVWRHSVVQQNPAHNSVQGSTRVVYTPGQIRV
jgi:hypothetical protein